MDPAVGRHVDERCHRQDPPVAHGVPPASARPYSAVVGVPPLEDSMDGEASSSSHTILFEDEEASSSLITFVCEDKEALTVVGIDEEASSFSNMIKLKEEDSMDKEASSSSYTKLISLDSIYFNLLFID